MKQNSSLVFFLFILFLLGMASCVQHKELVSFPSESMQLPSQDTLSNEIELKVQPDDLLRITVHSFNPEAVAPFNIEATGQQNMQMMGQAMNSQGNYMLELFNGYFVDREGYISFPVVGRLKVQGLTLLEVERLVTEGTKPYLKDAVVNARFLNFKVTVTGEVARPGVIRLSNQRMTILEAIGNAGDFTPYANRTNVLLVREEYGKRYYQRLNFQEEDLFNSPFFYLKQNDVIYVEPIQAKVATVQDPFARGVTYGSAFISIITLAVALFR
jgi:polysaccharide export outer membrane protein